MAKFSHIRNTFLQGEVSPKILGRTDIDQYAQMCEQLRNAVVYPQGGAGRRVGTEFIADISASSTTEVKLIPFNTSLGDFIIIIAPNSLSAVEVGQPPLTTHTLYDFTNKYDYENTLNGIYATDWSYSIELSTKQLQYSQFGDVLFITSPFQAPLIIFAQDELDGPLFYAKFGNQTFEKSGTLLTNLTNQAHRAMAWLDENTTALTLDSTNTAIGATSLTASAPFFTSDMVSATGEMNTMFRIRSGASVGVVYLQAVTNSTTATGTILVTLPTAAATANWSESAWSYRQGFPRTVQFHQQRLFWGGTKLSPDTVWASQIGDFNETSKPDPTSTFSASDALRLTFATNDLATINFMSSGRNSMEIGTNKREVNLQNATQELAAAELVFTASYESSDGSAYIQPVRVNNTLLFLDRFSQRVKEYSYDFREDSFKTSDLNYFADEFFKNTPYGEVARPKEMCYQSVEHSIIWFNCTDSLVGLTRNREYSVFAWHRHYLGGVLTGSSAPKINSLCNITVNGIDEVYMAVKRTIDGNTVIYLERMGYEFDASSLDAQNTTNTSFIQKYPIYMDCACIRDVTGTPTTTWSFPELEGAVVSIIADGNYIGEMTVGAAGALVTASAYEFLMVGFNYETRIVPIALQNNALFGSGLGQIKRIDEVTMLFNRTVGAKFGILSNDDTLQLINFRPSSTPGSSPTPLFTGEKIFKLTAAYEKRQNLMIVQDVPLPFQLTAIIAKGQLYD